MEGERATQPDCDLRHTGGSTVTHSAQPSRDAVNKIFGDALPESTTDDLEPNAERDADLHDRWLRDNIPPHHD
jgi:hypothetical protein